MYLLLMHLSQLLEVWPFTMFASSNLNSKSMLLDLQPQELQAICSNAVEKNLRGWHAEK